MRIIDRRDFIKLSGLAVAGLTASPVISASNPLLMKITSSHGKYSSFFYDYRNKERVEDITNNGMQETIALYGRNNWRVKQLRDAEIVGRIVESKLFQDYSLKQPTRVKGYYINNSIYANALLKLVRKELSQYSENGSDLTEYAANKVTQKILSIPMDKLYHALINHLEVSGQGPFLCTTLFANEDETDYHIVSTRLLEEHGENFALRYALT